MENDYFCKMKKTFPFILILLLASCRSNSTKPKTDDSSVQTQLQVSLPVFEGDSAYAYVAAQTRFGPRVPGTQAHKACADWLIRRLDEWADTVVVQPFKTRVYDKTIFDGQNIVAIFNPKATKRIVLASHWDSRPFADHDPVEANRRKPIDGANDGASGVGVLMEMARLLRQQAPDPGIGVDIVLFDLEDYGPHTDERLNGDENFWALGSQYWSRNPHLPGYKANFGILLDMVGAPQAVFPREYFSQLYASWVLDKVWRAAQNAGYDAYFSNQAGLPISDDHVPVNQIAGIPMINIIHQDQNSSNGTFYEHWHTLNDNLSQIDPNTLKVVGDVLQKVIFEIR